MTSTKDIEWAARILRRGGLIAFPTETVYGLGAHALLPEAVRAIFKAKGRPSDNPLIVHIGRREDVSRIARDVPESALRLMNAFWPGPLSIVLPRRWDVPDVVTGGRDTVAIRMPDHPVALRLLQVADVPVAAPSANRSGAPSPTTSQAVLEDLGDRIDGVLDGGVPRVGLESTVVDCTGIQPVVLRHGGIPLEELRLVEPDIRVATTAELGAGRSPGARHVHYRPRARVWIVTPGDAAQGGMPPGSAWIGQSEPADRGYGLTPWAKIEVVPDVETYARRIFAFFRECDREGIAHIHCENVQPGGLGEALMDRLRRAAGDDSIPGYTGP